MMNVNAQYKLGIDTTTLQQVSQEILKRAAEKNSQYVNTNTSFVNNVRNAADLGLDLYKGNVDTNVARQIAMNNSGLQIQLNQNVLNSISYLNAKAAQNVQKNVEGRITVALNEGVGRTERTNEPAKFNSIVSLATGKDKNGSAPSYKGEFLFIKREKDKEEAIV